jgi:hypothetical protein
VVPLNITTAGVEVVVEYLILAIIKILLVANFGVIAHVRIEYVFDVVGKPVAPTGEKASVDVNV